MDNLEAADLDAQSILELPARTLTGAVIWVSGTFDLAVLDNMLNDTFQNWSISVLDNNHVQVTVQDDLTGSQMTVFCDEVATEFAAQCVGQLT